jgi:hypothetical protein
MWMKRSIMTKIWRNFWSFEKTHWTSYRSSSNLTTKQNWPTHEDFHILKRPFSRKQGKTWALNPRWTPCGQHFLISWVHKKNKKQKNFNNTQTKSFPKLNKSYITAQTHLKSHLKTVPKHWFMKTRNTRLCDKTHNR